MEVTFTLTPDDVWLYSRRYRYRSMQMRPALVHACLGLTLTLAALSLWIAGDVWHRTGSVPWGFLAGLAVMLWMSFLFLPPTRGRIARFIRKQPKMMLTHFLSIDPAGLSAKTSADESRYPWQTMYSLEEDAGYLFLFISRNSAFIVPKRAFATLNEAQTFLDTARRFWEAQRGQPLPAEDSNIWPPPPRRLAEE